ncbi:hypothetical protein [uncultured Shewanella sp.]|uniref:hypothetical protein n=1 Tax=uncultured Shewanella sp. TaxID=173975 RepID=UPI00261914B3|nr:hypothetical protein [uncultured Shewanella sp.]
MKNKAESANTAIEDFKGIVGSIFYDVKMITFDNGTECAGNDTIAEMMDAEFYFMHSFCENHLERFFGLAKKIF